MHQETTIINGDELFGNFSDPNEFQDCREGFEKYWEWPDEMGNGFMYMIKLRPGLMLGVGNYRLMEDIALSFKFKYSSVVLGFSVSGNVSHTVNYEESQKNFWHFKHGHSVITYLPPCQGVAKYPAGTPVRGVCFYIDPFLLNTFMGGQHDQIPIGMRSLVNGADEKFYYQVSTTTPSVNVVIHQILNCPYQFPLKRLYLESKALELITHSMAQFVPPETALQKSSVLRQDDIERVREARDILISNMENPPSLLELSHQVGLNDYKLKIGFRQVFGTTVFGYLRECRMERAKLLFEEHELNVAEVAFSIGYTHPGHFAAAFKKQFGIKPSSYLSEITKINAFDISTRISQGSQNVIAMSEATKQFHQ